MKRNTLLFICILFLSLTSAFAQNQTDSIQITKSFGTVFTQNGKKLNYRQLLEIMSINFEAYKEMEVAKTNIDVSSFLGFAAGAFIGWPFGTAIAGGDPNWALVGIGAGLIVITIPFSVSATKHATNAVSIYNTGLNKTGYNPVKLQFGMVKSGVGLKLIL